MGKIVCFTGHRDIPSLEYTRLAEALASEVRRLIADGVTDFRAGGARGFDTMAALAVLSAKKDLPSVRLHLFLPYPKQADAWRDNDRCLYEQIKCRADTVHYTSSFYYRGVLQARNRDLVEGSDLCVAYLRTSHGGGAAYTVALALRRGLDLINLGDVIASDTPHIT